MNDEKTLAKIRQAMIVLENDQQTDTVEYQQLSDDFLTIATNIVESALFEEDEDYEQSVRS